MNHGVFDLYWLARRDKDLPLPEIRFVENWSDMNGAIACYWGPRLNTPVQWIRDREEAGEWDYLALNRRNMIWLDGGELVSCARGLIVVDRGQAEDRDVASCIAHEWRHHWQTYNVPGLCCPIPFDQTIEVDAALIKYYRGQPREADALRYELEIAPDDSNRHRASLLGWPFPQRSYLVPGQIIADWFSDNLIIRGLERSFSWS